MAKYTGQLCFDVEIEEQTSEEAIDKISDAIRREINHVPGVDSVEEVDRIIDVEDDDQDVEDKD